MVLDVGAKVDEGAFPGFVRLQEVDDAGLGEVFMAAGGIRGVEAAFHRITAARKPVFQRAEGHPGRAGKGG